MITVAETIVIECPMEEIFPMLADPSNHLKWDKGGLKRVEQLTNGPLGVGSKFIFTLGDADKMEVEYTEYEPNRHLIQHFKIKYGEGSHKFELVTVPEGTRFHQEISNKPKGMYRMFRSTIQTTMEENVHAMSMRIKRFMETGTV